MEYAKDLEAILSHRYDLGSDYWSTADNRIYKGNPFSTISSLLILYELGLDSSHEAVRGGINRILSAIRSDGRIRIAPKLPLHPCYTAEAARVLCRYGYKDSGELIKTKDYFLASSHEKGGWRCSFSGMGKGQRTELANPGATLFALDYLRFYSDLCHGNAVIDAALNFLLTHWQTRLPLGPCAYGIGTQFLRVEFPFLRYNIFFYAYVLSFYTRAREDARFTSVLDQLKHNAGEDEVPIVQYCNPRLRDLNFCKIGTASKIVRQRYGEIFQNLGR